MAAIVWMGRRSPSKKYPILVFGINVKRWEKWGGQEIKLPGRIFQFWIDREDMGPSELQKYSRFSLQITWPLLFKFSWYWRFQKPGVPGSELGLFLRLALWRIDYAMEKYIGPGSYYLGLNDD